MLVVHPHFHARRTGATTHVEAVVPALGSDARAIGSALSVEVPRVGLWEVLRRARSETVVWHAHRNHELLAGLLLRLFAPRLRLVFTRHSTGPASWLTRFAARRAHRAIALTRFVAEGLGVPAEIVGHGIDLTRFSPPPDRAEAWRALGVGGRFGIGVVGRVRKSKGHGDFAEALAPLLPAAPEWRAVWVGLTKERDRTWADAEAVKLGPLLARVGEQRDVAPWYRGLSVLVQPSHQESFSLVLLEAMASGCCVVAAQMPHYPELIEHGRTGLLYPPGDVKALRDALEPLLREPARAQRIGEAAAEAARARFGIEHEAKALADVYARL